MASIACSNIGIMIKGTLVFMKVGDHNGNLWASAIFTSFGMAITDIVTKKRKGKSVINISLSKSIIYKTTFVHTNLLYRCPDARGTWINVQENFEKC
jgi:hypothetical protein